MMRREEIAIAAERILEERRSEADSKKEAYLQEINARTADFKTVEDGITRTGLSLVKLALRKNTGTPEYIRALAELERLGAERTAILKENGFDENFPDNCHYCAKCLDKGRYEEENGAQRVCECFQKVCRDIVLRESGLPVKEGFEAFDRGVFDPEDLPLMERNLAEARAFAENLEGEKNLFMFGQAGSGKTYLASLTATELIRQGWFAIYISAPLLMQTLLYFGDDERAQERRSKLYEIVHNADLVVLDELGTEKLTDSRQDMLTGIIDDIICDGKRKCIVISNLTLKEIRDNYGERLFSRFGSMNLLRFETKRDLRLR
ncbi:MAG: ATP-binding protein [Clostridia bacterium]|nr:ATP-binding protein [Clostridia bacterium]